MKLIYKETKKPVEIGDRVFYDGTPYKVTFFREPHKPSSEGKVSIKVDGGRGPKYESEVYVSVIGAEWIEREDRGWLDLSKFLKPGSISSGTLRSRHLIPPFMDALRSVAPEEASDIEDEYKGVFRMLGNGEDPECDEDWGDDCNDLVNESLFNALNEHCPPFFSFGSHEGDGADFGVWFCRESFDDAVREGRVRKVEAGEDWQSVETDAEYVAEVTDHGNITLYTVESKQELWSLV